MGGIRRRGESARHIIATHGREATRYVLELACAAIRNGPDAGEIDRLATLMREIKAAERRRIQAVAQRFALSGATDPAALGKKLRIFHARASKE
ncbi:MAG: hypothetical protein JWN66_3607 [Sphingomonas bacterium]|uniref:hypothetical protein n=1 Tax=Sphingomonas bacterium TaxID=1895847 RepID=UPI00262B63E4|nr:hypothetical protein [Sphingomonas bacterium]MDB5706491.1 hypothetical protein [Sphingomonas bacterium]